MCGGKAKKTKLVDKLFFCPHKSMIGQHIEALGKNMDLYTSAYENFNFLGDFNAGMEHSALKDFFNLHSLTSRLLLI